MITLRLVTISLMINSFCLSADSKFKLSKEWYFSIGMGSQMSGIKPEDFVQSNYSSLISISAGKDIDHVFGYELGMKGIYFYTISDTDKHYYSFIYLDVVINTNSLIKNYNLNRIWNLKLHGGPGFFYNFYYGKPNLCGNLGIQNSFKINQNLQVYFDINSIVGWDIYQGNEDILPGLLMGINFNL